MKIKVFAIGILICMLCGVSVVWGAEEKTVLPQGGAVKNGRIEIDAGVWNVGDISAGGRAEKTFLIHNVGQGELFINEVRVTCDCIKTSLPVNKVYPNQSVELKMVYDSTGRNEGKDQKRIYISSNDPESPSTTIVLTANIIPDKKKTTYLTTGK